LAPFGPAADLMAAALTTPNEGFYIMVKTITTKRTVLMPSGRILVAVLGFCTFAASAANMNYRVTEQPPKMAWSSDFEVAIEARHFFDDPVDPAQAKGDYSGVFEAEFVHDFESGNGRMVISPFARWDSDDDERTHFDLREAYLNWYLGNWEILAGVSKVFWGATESAQLVDLINQTDQVENSDGEDKLGQPMLRVSWYSAAGNIEAFVLPAFRERTLPGQEGRLRFDFRPLALNDDNAIYEDEDKDRHIDYALRYSNSFAGFDLGISYFDGTSRDPRLVPNAPFPTTTEILPFYEQIQQASFDVTGQLGGWLIKAEGYRRKDIMETYGAYAAGFEYTLVGLFGSSADVGLLAEYMRDSRNSQPTLLQDDVFVGTRIAFNDVQSTEILLGLIEDRENDGRLGLLEASRRLGENGQLTLEYRQISGNPDTVDGFPNPAAALDHDDHVLMEYRHFF
jgi:hypothetical protein